MNNTPMHVVVYQAEQLAIWDAFVAASNNGTLFHRQSFLNYHGDKYLREARHLIFYREGIKGKIEAILPQGLVNQENGIQAQSPIGASYGGFLFQDLHYAKIRDVVNAFMDYLRSEGVSRAAITLPPSIYSQKVDAYQEFCLLTQGFTLVRRELSNVVSLEGVEPGKVAEGYRYSCDKQVRKAVKLGVEVKPCSDVETFHFILSTNRRKHGTTPAHGLEELKILLESFPLDILLFGAYLEGEMIGGSLCMAANARVLLNFYTCHREGTSQTGVVNLIDHHTLVYAAERGFRYYDFGTSTLGMEPNEGLLAFKETFGSTSVFRDTYAWEARE